MFVHIKEKIRISNRCYHTTIILDGNSNVSPNKMIDGASSIVTEFENAFLFLHITAFNGDFFCAEVIRKPHTDDVFIHKFDGL